MTKYMLTENNDLIVNVETGTFIPRGHRLWKDYENWLTEGNMPDPAFTLDEIRQNQINTIKQSFAIEPSKGLTTSLGLKVDSNREDKDNFQELLDYCLRKAVDTVTIRLWDNSFAEVTTADLQIIINEIQEHGLNLYQRKWAKEMAIEQASTEAEIKAITWESVE